MTPLELLDVYRQGCFPMAKSRDDDAFDIVAPYTRALLPLPIHIPKRLRRTVSSTSYHIKVDSDFEQTILRCADTPRTHESVTWINDHIISLFLDLHAMGVAHSVECWDGNTMVGGLYGLTLGSTFCGESMFSIKTDASKIALVHLSNRLVARGFKLLDSQFRNPHLDQFGLYEIPQADYVAKMQAGLLNKISFNP